MKTKLSFSLCLLGLFAKAQIIAIPDSNLKTILTLANTTTYQYAKNTSGQWIKIDYNGNGEIEQSEALAVTWLTINTPYYATIPVSNLTGIEHFTNLLYFECRNNPIQTINFALPHLLELNAWSCNLSAVNLSGLSTLISANFSYNNTLTNLDLSALINLQTIYCHYDQITSLDFSNNHLLQVVFCDNNQITSLDFSGLSSLQNITCDNNQITNLNFDSLNSLNRVSCSNNQISALDFTNNPLLTKLYCINNNLTSLTLKNGVNQDFSIVSNNDCWKTGNPNLTTVCADASELAAVQSYLNGCGDTAQVITVVSDCTMGNEEFGINEIKVFPNPTNSTININGNSSIKTVELYDIQGRVLVTKEVNANQTNLDISGYTNGVYFVKIFTGAGVKLEKVIKE